MKISFPLDFISQHAYDESNVHEHINLKGGREGAVYWSGFRNLCSEASFDGQRGKDQKNCF